MATHYTLSATELYGVDQKVELYNLFPTSNRRADEFIVFVVLPDFEKKSPWKIVNPSSYQEVSFNELLKLKDKSLSITGIAPQQSRYFNKIKLAIMENGQLRTGENHLLQFFAVRSYPGGMNIPFGTICRPDSSDDRRIQSEI